MRSKFPCSIAAAFVFLGALSGAQAADPKKGSSAAKKKSGDTLNDFDKQMQWENNVMGPDDKRAELAKIAKAQAITKAAAEKAAAEKAAAEKNPPKEEPKPEAKRATRNAAPVLLATPEDENAGKSTKSREQSAKDREISPKLSTAEAAAPLPPQKPADDKFIDKLLKGESGGKKKAAKNVNDAELNDLLAKETKEKPAPTAKGKKGGDIVDNLLRSAEKEPDMPAPKAKAPDWARPEIATPAPTPRPTLKLQPKKDDGIIHVVQGAAGSGSSRPAAAPARRGSSSDSFDREASSPRETASLDAPPPSRKSSARSAAASGSFSDPFSDSAPPARPVAARKAPPPANNNADPFADDAPAPPRVARSAPARVVAPPPRAQPPAKRDQASSGSFEDPFADPPRGKAKRTETKSASGRSGGFKDPFSEDEPAASPSRSRSAVVATKESSGSGGGGSRSGWAVLKKQSRR